MKRKEQNYIYDDFMMISNWKKTALLSVVYTHIFVRAYNGPAKPTFKQHRL